MAVAPAERKLTVVDRKPALVETGSNCALDTPRFANCAMPGMIEGVGQKLATPSELPTDVLLLRQMDESTDGIKALTLFSIEDLPADQPQAITQIMSLAEKTLEEREEQPDQVNYLNIAIPREYSKPAIIKDSVCLVLCPKGSKTHQLAMAQAEELRTLEKETEQKVTLPDGLALIRSSLDNGTSEWELFPPDEVPAVARKAIQVRAKALAGKVTYAPNATCKGITFVDQTDPGGSSMLSRLKRVEYIICSKGSRFYQEQIVNQTE